jgi:hypothetical protein
MHAARGTNAPHVGVFLTEVRQAKSRPEIPVELTPSVSSGNTGRGNELRKKTDQPALEGREWRGSISMSDTSDDKIRRWRLRIEECHIEAETLDHDGRQAMQSVIDSYERLIALVESLEQRKSHP